MSATAGELRRPIQQSGLIRALGLWLATPIVISDIIGTGIFLVTSDMARTVGSATMVFAGRVAQLFGFLFCPSRQMRVDGWPTHSALIYSSAY